MARPIRDPLDAPVDEQILKSASEVFSKFGFENTSMKDIAKKADITAGGLYYHYKNKQELFFACLEAAARTFVVECEKSVASYLDDPQEALREFAKLHIEVQFEKIIDIFPSYNAWVLGSEQRKTPLTNEQRRTLKNWEKRHFENLCAIIEAGVEKKQFSERETNIAAFAILGMCEHSLSWIKPDGHYHYKVISQILGDYALRIVRRGSVNAPTT